MGHLRQMGADSRRTVLPGENASENSAERFDPHTNHMVAHI